MGVGTKRSLQILISLCLLSLLFWFVDPRHVARSIAGANPFLLVFAVAFAFSNRILMAVKWNLLARELGVVVPWRTAISVYITSTFAGMFLPPTIGGDAVRTLILSRRYSKTAEIISSIVVERVLGLLVLAMFGLLAVAILVVIFAAHVPEAKTIALLIGVTAAILCAAVVLLTRSSTYVFIKRMIDRLARRGGFWARHGDVIEKVRISCETFNKRPFATATFCALTVVENLLAIVRAWLVAVAFGVKIDPLLFFVIIPIENFASRLPISFDGIGLREGVFISVLSTFNVSPATGLAIGLVYHLTFVVAVLPGAWFLATRWGRVIFARREKPIAEATAD